MARYNRIDKQLYRSCVEYEYFNEEGNVVRDTFKTDGYPQIGTARGARTVQINYLDRRYRSKGFTIVHKWDEYADIDWKTL
jgi:hypothetical protein